MQRSDRESREILRRDKDYLKKKEENEDKKCKRS